MLDDTMAIGRPKNEVVKVPASTRLLPDVHETLKKLADSQQRTLSQILEFAANEYAERNAKQKAKSK